MSSVEQRARNRLADAYDLRGWKDEANALRSGMPMDSPTVAALDTIAAALREQPETFTQADMERFGKLVADAREKRLKSQQPEARGVVDAIPEAVRKALDTLQTQRAFLRDGGKYAKAIDTVADYITAAKQPVHEFIRFDYTNADGQPDSKFITHDEMRERYADLREMKSAPPSAPVGVEVSGYIATVPDNCDRIIWRGHYHHLPLTQQPAQAAPGDGVHCATCTCHPGMTPAVRYDLTPAQHEGVIRDHLISLGWTPPGDDAAGGGFDDPAYSFSANPYEEPRP